VSIHFEFSPFTIDKIKSTLLEALIKVVESYSEPEDIIDLIETHDLFGKDCFYYINEYDLSSILNTPIFDKYISFKWNGRINYDCSVKDFSTPLTVLKNVNGKMLGPGFITKSLFHTFNFSGRIKLIQMFGLTSWKKSMKIRFITESLAAFALTMYFQVAISEFNWFIYILIEDAYKLMTMHLNNDRGPEFKELEEDILKEVGFAWGDF
jgi:hypothetical protein